MVKYFILVVVALASTLIPNFGAANNADAAPQQGAFICRVFPSLPFCVNSRFNF